MLLKYTNTASQGTAGATTATSTRTRLHSCSFNAATLKVSRRNLTEDYRGVVSVCVWLSGEGRKWSPLCRLSYLVIDAGHSYIAKLLESSSLLIRDDTHRQLIFYKYWLWEEKTLNVSKKIWNLLAKGGAQVGRWVWEPGVCTVKIDILLLECGSCCAPGGWVGGSARDKHFFTPLQ